MGRVIKLVIYYLAYTFGIGLLFQAGYALGHHTFLSDASDPAYFSLLMWGQAVSTLAVGAHLLYWKYVGRDELKMGFPHAGGVLLAAFLLMVGMGLWTNYLTEFTGLPDIMEETFRQAMNSPLGIISIVVLAPIVEELFFRGAIQGYLMRKWDNPMWAVAVSALIFGVMHGNPVQIFFAFILGIALGWMYYRTGSLLPCMLMHFANNGASVLLYRFSDSPDETMVEALGTVGAAFAALAGAGLTVFSVWIVKNRLVPTQVVWKEASALEGR